MLRMEILIQLRITNSTSQISSRFGKRPAICSIWLLMEIQSKDIYSSKSFSLLLLNCISNLLESCLRKRVTDLYSLPQCLTCNETITIPITEPAENSVLIGESGNCLYYFASFSVGSDYYALECLGDRIPITYIKSIDDKSIECELLNRLEKLYYKLRNY